jgi:hypothetical protein
MHEINSMNGLKSTIDDSKSNHLTNKIPPLKQEEEANNVLKWTEKDVEKWFRDKNVNKDILDNVLPCNGKLLNQLHKMKQEAPEFFYNSITSKKNIPTREVAIFTLELDSLCKTQKHTF